MKNIVDYAKDETLTFEEKKLNNVDSLIFTTLAYFDFSQIVPKLSQYKKGIVLKNISIQQIAKILINTSDAKNKLLLWQNLQNNPRFQNLNLSNYVEIVDSKKEIQFSALTFRSPSFIYIAYRGTSPSLIGFKEDFNMAYLSPVPSQKLALKYAQIIMFTSRLPIYLGGHSKGGNLAVYTAIHLPFWFKNRIKKIFTHDGPGFTDQTYHHLNYQRIKKLIDKTVPGSSIVGMLLSSQEEYKVVKSKSVSILQHNAFNWEIKDNAFVYLKECTWDSKYFNSTIDDWLNDITYKEKKIFVDAIYQILTSVDYATIDVTKNKWLNLYKTLKNGTKNLNPETKAIVNEILTKLKQAEINNLFNIKQK